MEPDLEHLSNVLAGPKNCMIRSRSRQSRPTSSGYMRAGTIARMDRLIVLDEGRVVEQGSHDELLALRGHYEKLWRHQSGGFLAPDIVPTETATEAEADLPEDLTPDEMRTEAMPKSGKEDVPVVTRA